MLRIDFDSHDVGRKPLTLSVGAYGTPVQAINCTFCDRICASFDLFPICSIEAVTADTRHYQWIGLLDFSVNPVIASAETQR